MTFTNFTIERSSQNNQSVYHGKFTGSPEHALRYQSKKLGIQFLPVTETSDYYRMCTPQGQIALTVYKKVA